MTSSARIYQGDTSEERALGERHLSLVDMLASELLKLYDNPKIEVVSTEGRHGVGRTRIANYVAEKAKRSGEYGRGVIRIDLRRDSSPRKVQIKIAESLGIYSSQEGARDNDDDDDNDDGSNSSSPIRSIAVNVYKTLLLDGNVKSLLILDNLQNDIDLGKIGVPLQTPLATTKVIVTIPPGKLDFPSLQIDRKLEFEKYHFRMVKVDDTIDIELLVGGARDVAESLQMHYNIKREPETILCCFFYLLLFSKPQGRVNGEELWRFYLGEGLVPSITATSDVKELDMNSIIEASKVIKTLVEEMIFHSIFERDVASNDVLLASHLWDAMQNKNTVLYCRRLLFVHKLGHHNDKLNWISLAKKDIKTCPMLLQQLSKSFVKKYSNLTTLLLCDNPQLKDIPDDFFEKMRSLRVLDLSTTAISSLPASLSQLGNCLNFLKLRNCSSLQTIPPTVKHLESLQLLDLYNTPLSNTIPDDSFEGMRNLRLLDLSYTKIASLPTSVSNCNKLELLFLRCCRSLVTLPSCLYRLGKLQEIDISYACQLKSLFLIPNANIKKLLLADCTGLEGMIVPHLQQLSALEELDISGCTALKDNSFDGQMPNLRVLNLSKTQFASVSLKGCWNLEIVHLQHLTKLEFLSLSGTKISEFPSEISQLTCLKRLDLVGTSQLKIFHWNEVEWLPKVLNWDQCGHYVLDNKSTEVQPSGDGSRAFISVISGKLLQGLSDSSPLWSNCLERFDIYIAPCAKQLQRRRRKDVVDFTMKSAQSVYGHLYCAIKGRPINYSRSFEIEGFKSLNNTSSMNLIASKVQFLSMRDCGLNYFLYDIFFQNMKEFRIERCRNVRYIFSSFPEPHRRGPYTLWVSQLSELGGICDSRVPSFDSLRHMYLGSCHKAIYLFPGNSLPNLETLEVYSCSKLEEIFSIADNPRDLQRLHTIRLWNLPLLNKICSIYLPTLKKLRVRGCMRLQKLPLFSPLPIMTLTESTRNPDAPSSIEIEGESNWCDNLKWMEGKERDNGLRHPIIFKRYHHPFSRHTDLVFEHQM